MTNGTQKMVVASAWVDRSDPHWTFLNFGESCHLQISYSYEVFKV